MDELAQMVGQDPLDYRLAHLPDERARRVLQAAALAAGWGEPTPAYVGRGLGFARYKSRGAYCAVVAEVEAEHDIRVRRLSVAVDVGQVVNPDGARNQIEGGGTQATSWTLKERVRFDRRRVTKRRVGELPHPALHRGAPGRRRDPVERGPTVGRRR